VLEVELQDQTAPTEWFFDDQPITSSERYILKKKTLKKQFNSQLIFIELKSKIWVAVNIN
jgi:hypothetical protein